MLFKESFPTPYLEAVLPFPSSKIYTELILIFKAMVEAGRKTESSFGDHGLRSEAMLGVFLRKKTYL